MPQLLRVIRRERPLDVVGERIRTRARRRDHVRGVHDAVVDRVVEQAERVADLMHGRPEVGRRGAAEPLAFHEPPRVRVRDRPVRGDARAFARHVVRVAGRHVVHDAAARGIEAPHRQHVVAPLRVEVGGIAPRQHRLVHLGIRPAFAARLADVRVAHVQRDLPADRVEDVLPVDAGAVVQRRLRDRNAIQRDRRPAQTARYPAHGETTHHRARRVLHIAGEEVAGRWVPGRRRRPRHLRRERALVRPAVGRREAVHLETERELVRQREIFEHLRHPQVVPVLRARQNRDAGSRVRPRTEQDPRERDGEAQRHRQHDQTALVKVAAHGAAVAVALDPHGPVIGQQDAARRRVVHQVAAAPQAAQLERGEAEHRPRERRLECARSSARLHRLRREVRVGQGGGRVG